MCLCAFFGRHVGWDDLTEHNLEFYLAIVIQPINMRGLFIPDQFNRLLRKNKDFDTLLMRR